MNFPNRRHIAATMLASLLGLCVISPVQAQDSPAKIIVGFPAGGSFDAIARMLAEKLKTELNRPVVVDNKTGAGGRIAVDALKGSPADGSVMMLGPDALTALYPYTFKKLNYDPRKDLVPVGTVAEFAFGFATGTAPKVNSWAEFVAWAKKNPQQANYGIPALGAPHHFYGMILGDAIGVPMQNVPFQGSAPIALALMGGQITSTIDVASSLVENHRAGKIKILAVTSESRIPQAPDVPTFTELGFPNVSGMGFNALYAPANTPAAAVATWNRALVKVLALPDVKEKLVIMGFLPVGKSTQELIDRQNAAARLWEPVIKASGFAAD
ncbi:MAG TPA: Bug family tripartite tricarboxylate transporter substrate binding protein [Ramlibacter sp.]|nr:Bug family tripartite tricarboxylate transporter substrate binding protein [Ramlibacter sp.]